MTQKITENKIKGMMAGVCLGDAIGERYEFSYGCEPYQDIILPGYLQGQVTDDTEMCVTLAQSLIKNRGVNETHLVSEYCQWVASNPADVGINTQKLFEKGPDQCEKIWRECHMPGNEAKWSQGNGCLMRAMPLAVIPDPEAWARDCSLTNAHPDCVEAHFVYCMVLRCVLEGKHPTLKPSWSKSTIVQGVISDVLRDGKKFSRDISHQRGWTMHALYCALHTYNILDHFVAQPDPFAALMRVIIGDNLNSDTDTNACIAGAVLGAHLGFEKLTAPEITQKNWQIIQQAAKRTNRPRKYTAVVLDEVVQGLLKIQK